MLQVVAGSAMSSGISEEQNDERHPLERVKGITWPTWQGWARRPGLGSGEEVRPGAGRLFEARGSTQQTHTTGILFLS